MNAGIPVVMIHCSTDGFYACILHLKVPRDLILHKHLQIHLLDSYNVDRGVSFSQTN